MVKSLIDALKECGAIKIGREEGASESLACADVELIPLVRMSELL